MVDSHFFEHVEDDLEASSVQSLQTFNAAAVSPGEEGRWIGPSEGVPPTGKDGSGDVAIHAALLRTGVTPSPTDSGAEILWFAGDANDHAANAKKPDGDHTNVDHTGIFKVVNSSLEIDKQFKVEKVDSPKRQNPPPGKSRIVDLFCSGHALLGDGRLLVAGGTEAVPPGTGPHLSLRHYPAIRDTFIFNPKTNAWSEAGQMIPQPGRGNLGGGRWYPSLLTLSSGRVAAFWGHPADDDTRHTNDTPEIFSPETLSWQFLGTEDDIPTRNTVTDEVAAIGYPRVLLLPNGRVFRASPVPDGDSTKNVVINPIPQSLTDPNDPNKISLRISPGPGEGYNVTGDHFHSSVLLQLTQANKYRARVLLAGGGLTQKKDRTLQNILVRPQLFEYPGEGWRATSERILGKARVHPNATILPTGEIFVSGGVDQDGNHVLEGEIYNPFKESRGPDGSASGGTWRTVPKAKVGREYHSVALLMPDGRVWHASTGSGVRNVEVRVDIYQPWYYSETITRPIIGSITGPEDPVYAGAPVMHLHDSGVTVAIDHIRSISKFALVRAGSVTHAFNYDQRYVELQSELLSVGGTKFTFRLTSPPSSNIAPPGNYLLFAIDDRGVPSVGRFIRIDREFVGELRQQAEDFTSRTGNVSVSGTDATALFMQWNPVTGNPVVEYGGIDFGPQAGVVRRFSALAGGPVGGVFDVRLDRPDGPQIATLDLPPGGSGGVGRAAAVIPVSGVHNVFIRFTPRIFQQNSFMIVDWFKFKDKIELASDNSIRAANSPAESFTPCFSPGPCPVKKTVMFTLPEDAEVSVRYDLGQSHGCCADHVVGALRILLDGTAVHSDRIPFFNYGVKPISEFLEDFDYFFPPEVVEGFDSPVSQLDSTRVGPRLENYKKVNQFSLGNLAAGPHTVELELGDAGWNSIFEILR